MTKSKTIFKESGYVLDVAKTDWYNDQYIQDKELFNSPFVNPSKNTNFESIPSTLVILATDDVLYSEGKDYATILKTNGVETELEEYVAIHGFSISNTSDEREAYKRIIQYLKKHKFLVD